MEEKINDKPMNGPYLNNMRGSRSQFKTALNHDVASSVSIVYNINNHIKYKII